MGFHAPEGAVDGVDVETHAVGRGGVLAEQLRPTAPAGSVPSAFISAIGAVRWYRDVLTGLSGSAPSALPITARE